MASIASRKLHLTWIVGVLRALGDMESAAS